MAQVKVSYDKGNRGTYNWRYKEITVADNYAPRYAVDVIKYARLQNTWGERVERRCT